MFVSQYELHAYEVHMSLGRQTAGQGKKAHGQLDIRPETIWKHICCNKHIADGMLRES